MRKLLTCLVLVAVMGTMLASRATADGESWGLAELLHGFQAINASHAHFVERRYLGMLSEPLKSSGTLAYTAPDKLEKITLTPRSERLLLDGDRLTIDQGADGQSRTLALSAHPEVAGVVESIRGTLAGDPTALARFYTLSLTGGRGDWTLRLEPKDATLRKLVSWIRIAGSVAAIHTIDTQESDGDRTEMIILDDPS
ncbi:MAG: LolA-related protein [Pseudomonadota bacterium]